MRNKARPRPRPLVLGELGAAAIASAAANGGQGAHDTVRAAPSTNYLCIDISAPFCADTFLVAPPILVRVGDRPPMMSQVRRSAGRCAATCSSALQSLLPASAADSDITWVSVGRMGGKCVNCRDGYGCLWSASVCSRSTVTVGASALRVAAAFGLVCRFPMWVYTKAHCQWVSGELAHNGVWDAPLAWTLHHLLSDADDEGAQDSVERRRLMFLDVGAHVGWFSLLAAWTGALVVSVEPFPRNIELLRANVELNRDPKRKEGALADRRRRRTAGELEIAAVAVSDGEREMCMRLNDGGGTQSNIGNAQLRNIVSPTGNASVGTAGAAAAAVACDSPFASVVRVTTLDAVLNRSRLYAASASSRSGEPPLIAAAKFDIEGENG